MPTCRCFVEGCDDEDGEGNFTQPFLEFSVPRDHGGSKFLRYVSFGWFQVWCPAPNANQIWVSGIRKYRAAMHLNHWIHALIFPQ